MAHIVVCLMSVVLIRPNTTFACQLHDYISQQWQKLRVLFKVTGDLHLNSNVCSHRINLHLSLVKNINRIYSVVCNEFYCMILWFWPVFSLELDKQPKPALAIKTGSIPDPIGTIPDP